MSNKGVIMTYNRGDRSDQSVLIIGKSQAVLNDTVAGLRQLSYKAEATNDFADITGRFDVRTVDLVVFGGQVPPDRRAELTAEIGAINPGVVFIGGLAGIPGLIISQVRAAFADADRSTAATDPEYSPEERSIRLTLARPAEVKVTAWWQSSFVPPDPGSDSLLLLEERLPAGDHSVPVPDQIPPRAAFATVEIDAAVYPFSIATEG
jgi:hypothetical protein